MDNPYAISEYTWVAFDYKEDELPCCGPCRYRPVHEAEMPCKKCGALPGERDRNYFQPVDIDKEIEQLFGVRGASQSIQAALEVVKHMADCLHLKQHGEQGIWEASFCSYPGITGHGNTAQLAICLAALEIKGVKI